MESQPVPYERKMLYLLVGGLLLLAGFLLLIFWSPDEFAFVKLLIMYVCIILGFLLVGAQFRDAYLRRSTRSKRRSDTGLLIVSSLYEFLLWRIFPILTRVIYF